MLAGGDLRAALKQYVAAVKLDRENQEYLQQYMLVRRAVALQDALAKETNPQQWEQMAVALRSFFSAQGLHAQALPLDRAMWERSKTADNAMQLADTLLVAGEERRGVPPYSLAWMARERPVPARLCWQWPWHVRARLEEAKQIASSVQAPAKEDPARCTWWLVCMPW